MAFSRNRRRMLLVALILAVPIETVGAFMLIHVPRIGIPRDPIAWHRFAGDITALVHAPWLILSSYLCAKLCPPSLVLNILVILGGYVDSMLLVCVVYGFVRMWRSV